MRVACIFLTLALALAHAEGPSKHRHMVVSFQPEVEPAEASRLLAESGARVVGNPDLLATDWLVEASEDSIAQLAHAAEVRKVFAASADLANGVPVRGCRGAISEGLLSARYQPPIGKGWGPGGLTWSLVLRDETVDPRMVRPILERALAEWSKHSGLEIRSTTRAQQKRSIDFVFGARYHGDPYPFDGQGGSLAHTYYPADITPEPLAGDIHLDTDENWTGGSPDLFTVVLHEIGHALGLAHSDDPGAVMYAYYRTLLELQTDDIAALHSIYPPGGQALTLNVVPPPTSTSAAALALSGTVTGGVGEAAVDWSLGMQRGVATGGRNWQIASVPLNVGENVISLVARDGAGAEASGRVSVTRSPVGGTVPSVPSVPTTPSTPQTPGGGSTDTSNPVLSITSPGASVFSTSATSVRISGTARDNVAVKDVTWQCGGSSGTATGTTSWSFTLPLLVGDNNLTVRVRDEAGNMTWRTRLIVRR